MALPFKKNQITFFLLSACVLAVGVLVDAPSSEERFSVREDASFTEIHIAGKTIMVEIADTETKRTQGLSGRESLRENEGMLFVFPEPDYHGFWMKDMQFPIDIVWLDENLRVISVTERIAPETFPEVFYPPKPIQFVLEVPAGVVSQKNLYP